MTWLTRKLYHAVDEDGNELWSRDCDLDEAQADLAQYTPGARLQVLVRAAPTWEDCPAVSSVQPTKNSQEEK